MWEVGLGERCGMIVARKAGCVLECMVIALGLLPWETLFSLYHGMPEVIKGLEPCIKPGVHFTSFYNDAQL